MQVTFEADDLRPIVEAVVAHLGDRLAPLDDRIGVDEAEAARLLGLKKNVLRDARLRGEISAAKIGKKYVYMRSDLIALLQARKAAGAP